MKIDATAKHIADVQVRDLVNMSNPTEVKQATVKAGGNTYSVSLSKGNIDAPVERLMWYNTRCERWRE